ncbi:uncharacterized protein RMCB_3469 [Mycolicibacterium brisbanense]|uniref:Uncharacterized protein n=1 Tax=Mycolicibacterium brisbanense TaxID=146020 RepID=A0A124E044_9MYCO|nr:uncharacterized protein RMCB_3469 [Mycolicibacterium brisbanense]
MPENRLASLDANDFPPPGESEFSHGYGLEPPQLVGQPPSAGGRYIGTSPRTDSNGHELPR